MWGPGDNVDRGGVEGEVEDALPLIALLAPDENLAVVACGSQDITVLGVSPGNAPDCSFVTMKSKL